MVLFCSVLFCVLCIHINISTTCQYCRKAKRYYFSRHYIAHAFFSPLISWHIWRIEYYCFCFLVNRKIRLSKSFICYSLVGEFFFFSAAFHQSGTTACSLLLQFAQNNFRILFGIIYCLSIWRCGRAFNLQWRRSGKYEFWIVGFINSWVAGKQLLVKDIVGSRSTDDNCTVWSKTLWDSVATNGNVCTIHAVDVNLIFIFRTKFNVRAAS